MLVLETNVVLVLVAVFNGVPVLEAVLMWCWCWRMCVNGVLVLKVVFNDVLVL